ncbi:hypothetical protein Dimus_038691 [Dionaea muscipula]
MAYPQLTVAGTTTPTFLTERIILSTRNDDVNAINSIVLDMFPGEKVTYLAADKMLGENGNNVIGAYRYPNEFLNTLDPPGLPPFKLELKVGCPVILLRNIFPKTRLCNGTRLVITKCPLHNSFLIEAQILSGELAGNFVFIPRISLSPSSSEMPLQMTRHQFPIRLAYALTIKKSRDDQVKYVGVDLRTPVFSHGQLYVALFRCTSFDRINILLPEDGEYRTKNIVYPEVLLQ